MDEQELKERTKQLALRVLRVAEALPNDAAGSVIARELVKAGTAVGAQYHAACRRASKSDALARLAAADNEAGQTLYWLELLVAGDIVPEKRLKPLMEETEELRALIEESMKDLHKPAGLVPRE